MALSPALLFAVGADGGLSRLDGLVLLVAFVLFLWAIYRWENQQKTRYLDAEADEFPDVDGGIEEEEEPLAGGAGLLELGILLATVIGMTVGSELAVTGARGILDAFGLVGLAFGATIMSFIASLEEILLTVEPVRAGRPEVGIGNIIGSTLFFVTANAGVIALVQPVTLSETIFAVHWPFFLGALTLVVVFLYRGRIKRLEGGLMLTLYVGYWLANYLL